MQRIRPFSSFLSVQLRSFRLRHNSVDIHPSNVVHGDDALIALNATVGIESERCAEESFKPAPGLCLEFGSDVFDGAVFLYGTFERVNVLSMEEESPRLEPQEFIACVPKEIESAVVDLTHGPVACSAIDGVT